MAAKSILNGAKSPLGHFLRSSALSAVRIAAIPKPLAEVESLRLSLFDAKARDLVGDGRIWAQKPDSFGAQARGPRKVDETEDDSDEDDSDFDAEDMDDSDFDDEDDVSDDLDDDDDESDFEDKRKR